MPPCHRDDSTAVCARARDAGVLVGGAPDQPEGQRRQAGDGDEGDVGPLRERQRGDGGVDDMAAGDEGEGVMQAADLKDTARWPARGCARREKGVVQGGGEGWRYPGHVQAGEVLGGDVRAGG